MVSAMSQPLALHHVTAVAADAQANVDFYAGTLGLTLVKQTVNYDDPAMLHLYYGDAAGSPGSLVTFFVIPGAAGGRVGWPQVTGVEFDATPMDARRWRDRLVAAGFAEQSPDPRALAEGRLSTAARTFTEWRDAITLPDPDGMPVLLSLAADAGRADGFAPPAALRDAVLSVGGDWRPTAEFLQKLFDLPEPKKTVDKAAVRFPLAGGGELVVEQLDAFEKGWGRGRPGAGTVHHVALRAADAAAQLALREKLLSAGVGVSPVMDRTYFKSIYFREPGGVLLEVATDGPGMAADEPADALGRSLRLPPELEGRRDAIEAELPTLRLPR